MTRFDGISGGGSRRSYAVIEPPQNRDGGPNGSSLPPNQPSPIQDTYGANEGGSDRLTLGGFDLGSYPSDPDALREELSKSYAGVDKEGLRKMEEEARRRRELLQQSIRMNRGDPYLAARSKIRSNNESGTVGSIAATQNEQLDPLEKHSNPIIIMA